MADKSHAGRLRCFLAVEQAEGATDDDPVIDGIDTLTFGDLRGVLAERDDAVGTVERWTPELRDKRNDLLDIRGILSPADGPRRVPPGVEMVPAAAPAVLWIAEELDRVRSDLADVRAEADALVNNLGAARAERDQLRRQLDAAEAAPCDHDSTAFEALERLHGRVHRDFNFDASESAAPDDERWARVMDDLVRFADEVYLPLADATRAAPQRSTGGDETDKYPPHTVTVTHLPPGFDHQDRREHEYVVGNDTVGWTSHQVEHPDACHRLPYGRHCWLDENWYEGPYRYDEIEPGRYQATRVSEMVGDHNGEFSHMDEYVHYERTGDAPGHDAEPNPLESVVTEALADIAAQPADPEPVPPAPPWLVPAGDD